MKTRIIILILSVALFFVSCVTEYFYATAFSFLLPIVTTIWAEWDGFKTKKDLTNQIDAANHKIKSYDKAFQSKRAKDGSITAMTIDSGEY